MSKPAGNDHPIHPLLKERYSARSYTDRPVPSSVLRSLFEAARWAPSLSNEQPWHFIVAVKENRPDYDRMAACLMESQHAWALTAPVLILCAVKSLLSSNQKPYRHARHDLGLAVMNLTVQAAALRLSVRQIGSFYPDKARTEFGVPADLDLVTLLAVGVPGDPDLLPEPV